MAGEQQHGAGVRTGLAENLAASVRAASRRGPPPVERWNPPYCGEIDMRIARDGSWHYLGTPIGRPALVKLFASVLRRDAERYVLVTPVERVGIAVDDVPFLAVEMTAEEGEAGQALRFRTNVDDETVAGPDHPMRFEADPHGGYRPYVHVRGGLWARLTRQLWYDLVSLCEEATVEGGPMLVVRSRGAVFPIAPIAGIGGEA